MEPTTVGSLSRVNYQLNHQSVKYIANFPKEEWLSATKNRLYLSYCGHKHLITDYKYLSYGDSLSIYICFHQDLTIE